jgi:hypothetical protein
MGFGSYGILFFPSELKYGNFGKNLMMPIYGFDAVRAHQMIQARSWAARAAAQSGQTVLPFRLKQINNAIKNLQRE